LRARSWMPRRWAVWRCTSRGTTSPPSTCKRDADMAANAAFLSSVYAMCASVFTIFLKTLLHNHHVALPPNACCAACLCVSLSHHASVMCLIYIHISKRWKQGAQAGVLAG
jgi:hypothetical protein